MLEQRSNTKTDIAGLMVGYRSGHRYRVRGNFLFRGIDLRGAYVLEIGCGTGAWAIWTSLHGASKVVAIDPEAAGSSKNSFAEFQRNIETFGLQKQIQAIGCSLEDLPKQQRPFDVVVMYNVINHLDEDAVMVLHKEQAAFERYVTLLKNLRSHMRSGSWLVVADCARDNLWANLGLTSPFVPSIEWEKHQNPKTWIEVVEHAGFRTFDLRWSPLQPFPALTGNRLVEYLTCSHFALRFRVPEEEPRLSTRTIPEA